MVMAPTVMTPEEIKKAAEANLSDPNYAPAGSQDTFKLPNGNIIPAMIVQPGTGKYIPNPALQNYLPASPSGQGQTSAMGQAPVYLPTPNAPLAGVVPVVRAARAGTPGPDVLLPANQARFYVNDQTGAVWVNHGGAWYLAAVQRVEPDYQKQAGNYTITLQDGTKVQGTRDLQKGELITEGGDPFEARGDVAGFGTPSASTLLQVKNFGKGVGPLREGRLPNPDEVSSQNQVQGVVPGQPGQQPGQPPAQPPGIPAVPTAPSAGSASTALQEHGVGLGNSITTAEATVQSLRDAITDSEAKEYGLKGTALAAQNAKTRRLQGQEATAYRGLKALYDARDVNDKALIAQQKAETLLKKQTTETALPTVQQVQRFSVPPLPPPPLVPPTFEGQRMSGTNGEDVIARGGQWINASTGEQYFGPEAAKTGIEDWRKDVDASIGRAQAQSDAIENALSTHTARAFLADTPEERNVINAKKQLLATEGEKVASDIKALHKAREDEQAAALKAELKAKSLAAEKAKAEKVASESRSDFEVAQQLRALSPALDYFKQTMNDAEKRLRRAENEGGDTNGPSAVIANTRNIQENIQALIDAVKEAKGRTVLPVTLAGEAERAWLEGRVTIDQQTGNIWSRFRGNWISENKARVVFDGVKGQWLVEISNEWWPAKVGAPK